MIRILLMVLQNIWRVPGAYLKLCRYAKHPERYTEKEMYDHINYIMTMAVTSGNVNFQVFGEENIPEKSGFLMYGNHQGMFDIVAIAAACKTPLAAVFKIELANIPFLKQIIACTNSFAMDRDDVRQSMTVIQNVIKEVKNGRNYLIFPEGTRSRNGNQMVEFHAGSFRCALKTQCPIIPLAYIDSYKVLDEKGVKPVTVQLHFLEPILYEEYKDMKTQELAEFVKSRIQAALDQYAG